MLRATIRAAEAEGIAVDEVLARHRVPRAQLSERDARFDTALVLSVMDELARSSARPSFGAHIASFIDGSAFGLLGFVVASCATLEQAWTRFAQYTRLLCDELRFELEPRGEQVAVVYSLACDRSSNTLYEMALVHLVMASRKGTQGRFAPSLVRFRHRADEAALRAAIGAPIESSSTECALLCDRSALSLSLRGSNRALLDVLESHATLVLGTLAPSDDFIARVHHEIRVVLHQGEPTLDAIAARLHLGGRTLQRRLKDEGLTFRAAVDHVRFECARERLENPEVSVAEVAYSLGFSSPSAFSSAYRRWAGSAPGRARSR